MSCRCRPCEERALGTRGAGGGDGSLSFPAATLCQPINVGAPFSSPREQRPLSSLPCCCRMAPAVVRGGKLVTARSVRSGVREDLFPCSVSNRSASHLFSVRSLSSCLFCLSRGCCWRAALVGAGGDQTVLSGTPAPGIGSHPAGSRCPGEGTERLPLCLLSKNRYAVAWPPSIHPQCQGLTCQFGPGSSGSVVPRGRDWVAQALHGQDSKWLGGTGEVRAMGHVSPAENKCHCWKRQADTEVSRRTRC